MKKIAIMTILLCVPISINAQDFSESRTHLFGYAGNFPDQPYGLFFCRTDFNEIDLYGDFYFTTKAHTDAGESKLTIQDIIVGQDADNYSVHLGMTRVMSVNSVFYFGFGPCLQRRYIQYQLSEELGSKKYWVLQEKNDIKMSAVAGFIILLKQRLVLKIGGNARPLGMNVGLGFITSSK